MKRKRGKRRMRMKTIISNLTISLSWLTQPRSMGKCVEEVVESWLSNTLLLRKLWLVLVESSSSRPLLVMVDPVCTLLMIKLIASSMELPTLFQ